MKSLLVIPAFDEEPTIGRLIESARKHIADVLVIDDGSHDATTLESALAGAMIHRLKTNMGKGEALKTAFGYATEQGYDWVLTMDGNGQHDPGDIPSFLPLLGQSGGRRHARRVRAPDPRRPRGRAQPGDAAARAHQPPLLSGTQVRPAGQGIANVA